ncbi:FmdB family zinc ribbon protein [Algiphilus sp.]|uniref:FmdB family zinc ribbon protein n=1 Tax=Algiphilus sp. TaxID=1872431 RepID=UPI001CA67BF1|nr:FmdB family zinc ribbon protein [Algiphilus sp.]MBY8966143.1 zinc ribbon domain-containing protein [Algiphilus acroporae]MCI5061818.1 zinc ribbon domain-containing protein [Algiphilus sp.]MCI5103503.1 zinc ribbon domain-containing protein [Algiphilus sp.]MCR9089762.1 zinc ribbon domain-containing protein [Pseudomonadota bacterium]
MPFYEYQCPECGVEKEILHGINDKPEIPCEQCKGANLQRLISAAGFRLKGGGWYETDFKGDGSKRNLAGDSSAASSGGSGTDSTASGTSASSTKSSESSKSSGESKPAAKQASAD